MRAFDQTTNWRTEDNGEGHDKSLRERARRQHPPVQRGHDGIREAAAFCVRHFRALDADFDADSIVEVSSDNAEEGIRQLKVREVLWWLIKTEAGPRFQHCGGYAPAHEVSKGAEGLAFYLPFFAFRLHCRAPRLLSGGDRGAVFGRESALLFSGRRRSLRALFLLSAGLPRRRC